MSAVQDDPFATARAVADTVLLEGYVLYPYRASAAKNRLRWQFGVLTPPAYAAAHAETASMRTECIVDPGDPAAELRIEVRFLRVVHRQVEAARGDGFVPVERLDGDDVTHVAWDEGEPQRVEIVAPLGDLLRRSIERVETIAGCRDVEPVHRDGRVVGRLIRVGLPVHLLVGVSAHTVPGPYGTVRLTVTVENAEDGTGPWPTREDALRSSLTAAHTLLALSSGRFLSLAGPPEWARPLTATCVNEHTWPVLVGGEESANVVLSSPIILDDDPTIAPESETMLYDGTEIDEILTLRTMTLTDDEKREARGTDARAAALIDGVDELPPEVLGRLHGAIRSLRAVPVIETPAAEEAPPLQPWWDPGADDTVDPDRDRVLIAGVEVGKGAHVVLQPRPGTADAQDLFLHGRSATVQAVLHDVDGGVHVAVSVDDDPLAEAQAAHGRYRYFHPEELQPAAVSP